MSFQDYLAEMANYRPERTGLKMTIWTMYKTGNEKHGPRIKVNSTYGSNFSLHNCFTITISDEPKIIGNTGNIKNKDLKLLKKFIILNKETLMMYWNELIDHIEFVEKIKKVES